MIMNELKLYRKRFIPNEKIFLKDDEIVLHDKNIIITKWKVLKKRNDFTHGVSCYYLNENFKISKFIDENNNILYWYCDIIDWEFDKENNTYVFNDLLIDIIVYDNGLIKVVDMDEVAEALDKGIIDIEIAKKAIRRTDNLLRLIYSGKFEQLKYHITNI